MFSNLRNIGGSGANEEKEILERINILKSVSIFSEAKDSVLRLVAKSLEKQKFIAGDIIFKKGDKHRALYIIENGLVKVHIDEHIFATFSNNQIFGEYSLIDSTERSATVSAIKDSHVLVLEQSTFKKISLKNPEITDGVLNSLVNRLRKYNEFEKLITRQKAEIEKQREELVSLNHTKDKFFSIIAHDLKNPFSTVVSLSEVLATDFHDFDDEKRLEFSVLINQYSNNTYNLLENLLQWANVQTGRLKKHPDYINLSKIVNENIELLKGNALNKNISLESSLDEKVFAFADEQMINTVIRNLISNAIKFTQVGGNVKISHKFQENKVQIFVKDDGIGIDEEDQKKLFRIDSNPTTIGTSEEKGTGLGLILCQEFIQANKGSISVYSEIDKGSEFCFILPVEKEIRKS